MVIASPDYSPVGWAFILVGISWPPRSVAFRCRKCGELVERLTDPAIIKELPVIT